MPKTYEGRTEDAKEAPYLGAEFWQKGTKITGAIEEVRTFLNGVSYVLSLPEPVEVAGQKAEEVAIGNLAGFRRAISAAGLKKLPVGCFVEIECTSIKRATKEDFSDSPNFRIKVTVP